MPDTPLNLFADFGWLQWIAAAVVGVLVGFSKSGVPTSGVLVVVLLAILFNGRLAVGVMLPLLIFADMFAVAWFHRHTKWQELRHIAGWVIPGLILGALFLWKVGQSSFGAVAMNRAIGAIVLMLIAVHLYRLHKSGPLRSAWMYPVSGILAGFTTTVSNAAGPVMAIYLSGARLSPVQFVGTNAWFFCLVNISKLPILIGLSMHDPRYAFITPKGLWFDLIVSPFVVAGLYSGRWLLRRIPPVLFERLIIGLSALSAVWLLVR